MEHIITNPFNPTLNDILKYIKIPDEYLQELLKTTEDEKIIVKQLLEKIINQRFIKVKIYNINEPIKNKNLKDTTEDEKNIILLNLCKYKKSLYLIKKVIQAGADVNIIDNTGETPLSYSFSHGNRFRDVQKYLLKIGAYDYYTKEYEDFFYFK